MRLNYGKKLNVMEIDEVFREFVLSNAYGLGDKLRCARELALSVGWLCISESTVMIWTCGKSGWGVIGENKLTWCEQWEVEVWDGDHKWIGWTVWREHWKQEECLRSKEECLWWVKWRTVVNQRMETASGLISWLVQVWGRKGCI